MHEQNGRGDVRAIRIAQRHRLSEAIGVAGLGDEMAKLARPAADVVLVEQAFAIALEEARHVAFEHVPARRDERRPGGDLAAERQHVGFVAARSMEKENRRKARVDPRLEAMDVGECARHQWFPRDGGNLSARPSESMGSSTAKPGGSVAISNSTRPGSRK